jgi:Putative transposase, YhgA-like
MTLADEPSPRDTPDRVFRRSLRHPEHLRAFLRQAVPDLADGFDFERARLLDREFPLDDWRRREADLPFEIPYRVGDQETMALVCLLIEHQSDTDPLMPLRLLYFAVVYWDRQWHAWEGSSRPRPPLRLQPVLPIVLYTGRTPWGSNRTLVDLLGEPTAFHAFAPSWRPIFWNLADQTPEALLNSGMEWLQTLAVIRAESAEAVEFRAVYEEAVGRLGDLRGRDKVRWYDLMRIVLTWAAWRRPRAEQPALWAAVEASQADPEYRQEVRIMTQTAVEAWIEEGMAKGLAQGELLTSRKLLRELLEKQFGPLPTVLLEQIAGMNDAEKLQMAFRQALDLENLADLKL